VVLWSKEKFDAADKTTSTIKTGVYYQILESQNFELLSRSSHQSQGFGSGRNGEDSEYLELTWNADIN
jgi:hypothetical protein